jgi:hypothetical protein
MQDGKTYLGTFTNEWNVAALYVETSFNGNRMANASSFLWAHASKVFLVTNWHVLSGRSALTGEALHTSGGIPNELRIHAYVRTGPMSTKPDSRGFRVIQNTVVVPLVNATTEEPKWIEHPFYGRRADVAALDVTDALADAYYECANRLEGDRPPTHMNPGHDAFVVGFPFGLMSGAPAPIWKRGSIALDPGLNPEGLPKMLIDTATREGMSGSAVIAMFPVPEHETRRFDDPRPVYLKEYPAVIGVYSGRHYPDLERAQLGIVWKRSTIEEVVWDGVSPVAQAV